MERLSGIDAAFLYFETPAMHMHVTGVLVLDPSTMTGDGPPFEAIRHMLESRMHLLPPFRRKVVPVPFQLDHPVWVDDPGFDIENHLHRIGCPSPGGMHELADLVADIAARPLDRTKPLWEMWVIEGLEHGYIAAVTKMHHCAIDGVSGADLMVHLFDLEPQPPATEAAPEWQPQPEPSDVEIVARAFAHRATNPIKLARVMGRTARAGLNIVRVRRRPDAPPAALPLTAPRTQFTGAITPHRSVAFGKATLDDFKFIKTTFGTTVNDVVLAACTGSVRRWLETHGGIPDKPLIASVPVSVRSDDERGSMGNRVSAMFVNLPVHLVDPVERLLAVHEETKGAKEVHHAMGADMLTNWAEVMGPALFTQAARLYSNLKLADRHRPVHNLVISNVPGPPFPLYCAGMRCIATYPLGPVMEGAGINITVLSNMGSVDFGVIACRDTVPELWDIAGGFGEAVDELRKAAAERGSATGASARPKKAAPKAPPPGS
jgi:WS/DGAT/MGAT family acyltransferase